MCVCCVLVIALVHHDVLALCIQICESIFATLNSQTSIFGQFIVMDFDLVGTSTFQISCEVPMTIAGIDESLS